MLEITNPRQTVLVTCRHRRPNPFTGNEEEKDNIITVDWHMPCCFKPGYYAISIGKSRYSYELINESNVFVVNFVSLKLAKAADYCGRNSGRHKDKFKEAGLTLEEAEHVDCCRIAEALAHIECHVEHKIETGDHVVFIGKVLGSLHKKDEDRLFHKLHGEYGAVN